MRNILLLVKNYILCGIGNLRRKNTRTKTITGMVLFLVLYCFFYALTLLSMISIAKAEAESSLDNSRNYSVLAMGIIVSIFFTLVFEVQKITGGQKYNDTDLLLSMPFKKTEIMIAKSLSRFAFSFALVFLIYIPSVIVYFVCTPFKIIACFSLILVAVLIPLMSVGISFLIDYLVTSFFSNSKFGNISKAVFTLLALVGIISIYEFFVINIDDVAFISDFIENIVTFNPIIMLPIIIGVVSLFILGNWLNGLLLNRETRIKHVKRTSISSSTTTPFKSLLKNETNRYFNSPTLMLNTMIGPLIIIALTVWLVIDHGNTFMTFLPNSNFLSLIIGLLFSASTIMTYPSAVSISLEGKQFWILRSMPIKANTVISAKAIFNLLLIVPLIFICEIVLYTTLPMSILNLIIMLAIPILTSFFVSYTGVLVNLFFPRFDYENEQLLIKQSLSAFIMLFSGMLLIFILGGTTLLLSFRLKYLEIAIIIVGILTVLTSVSITLCYTIGKRIFNRL